MDNVLPYKQLTYSTRAHSHSTFTAKKKNLLPYLLTEL